MEPNIQIKHEGDSIDFRTGQLPKPFNPQEIGYEGSITAPYNFFEKRKSDDGVIFTSNDHLEFSESLLIVNYTERTIILIVGENQPNKITVEGKLVKNPQLDEIGINVLSKRRNVKDLREFIKYNRHFLSPVCKFEDLLKQLQNVSTQFTTKVTEANNGTGNKQSSREIIIDNLPPLEIVFSVRIFEGMPKADINVVVECEEVNGELRFMFYSPELNVVIEEAASELIATEINKFDSKLAVIYQ